MTHQTTVSLNLSAAKRELRAALSSLERVSSHEYTPHQAALIRGAQMQIERAARITSQIYLKPPDSSVAASSQPQVAKIEQVPFCNTVKLLPPPKPVSQLEPKVHNAATLLPTEDVLNEEDH